MNKGGLSQWQKRRNIAITRCVIHGSRGEMERQAKLHSISRQRIKEIVENTQNWCDDELYWPYLNPPLPSSAPTR